MQDKDKQVFCHINNESLLMMTMELKLLEINLTSSFEIRDAGRKRIQLDFQLLESPIPTNRSVRQKDHQLEVGARRSP